MFCQKCGKEIPDGAGFCPGCGAPSTVPTIAKGSPADILQKENEVRLLQEKFDNEASHLGPIVLAIIGVITMIIVVGIVLIFIAWTWDKSRSAKATETEIKLIAAKTELQKMRGDAVTTSPPTQPNKNKRAIFFCGAIIIGIILALIVGWFVFAAASYGGAAITKNWTEYCSDNYPGSVYNPSTNTCEYTASPPPAPVQVTAAATTTTEPTSLTFSGSGDEADSFEVYNGGGYLVTGVDNGDSNFIVHLDDTSGNVVEYIFNEISPYSGTKVIHMDPGDYFLDVTSDGSWTITITKTT